MKKTIYIIIVMTLCAIFVKAQTTDTLIKKGREEGLAPNGLFFGLNAFNYVSPIIGYGFFHAINFDGRNPRVLSTEFSTELQISKQLVAAPKTSVKLNIYGAAFSTKVIGCSYLYYTDFKSGSHVIRPEAGINFVLGIELLYGYNVVINKSENFPLNKHNITLLIRPKVLKWAFK